MPLCKYRVTILDLPETQCSDLLVYSTLFNFNIGLKNTFSICYGGGGRGLFRSPRENKWAGMLSGLSVKIGCYVHTWFLADQQMLFGACRIFKETQHRGGVCIAEMFGIFYEFFICFVQT